MARILVAYASRYGQAAKIADHLANVAARRGHQVAVMDVARETPGLYVEDHDAVIFGASIHRARYDRSAYRFVERYGGFLGRVPSAFYSVSLSAAARTSEEASAARTHVDRFLETTGWHPAASAAFAGALAFSRYGFLTRRLLKRIAGASGWATDRDQELTDWQAVTDFAERFLDGISARARAAKIARGEARMAPR